MALPDGLLLLQRYNLSVEQLDYSFVRSCEDIRTLENIIRVLRSNQEGSYPHLLRYTEERLAQVHPQSRVLLTAREPTRPHDLPPHQLASLEAELANWTAQVKDQETELTRVKVIRAPLPPVRGSSRTEPDVHGDKRIRTRVPKLSTSELESLLTKGRQYFDDKNFLQASLHYQKVLASNPLNPEALQGMSAIQNQVKGRDNDQGALVQEIV
ncbi:sperm-associated antigen 1-like [Panulirus ornatus]|uniref:sperm-associated antigen 1-like n=1 Tax=Panulirus ornatus TaxID=150431 RepID=UPI003A8B4C55